MTHFNHKEEEFKNLLEGLELGIDTDAVWDQVEDRLPYQKNDYKLPFGFWLMSGLFCVGMLSLFLSSPDTTNLTGLTHENYFMNTESSSELYASTKAYEAAIDKVHNAKTTKANIKENLEINNGSYTATTSSNSNIVHQSSNTVTTSTVSISAYGNENSTERKVAILTTPDSDLPSRLMKESNSKKEQSFASINLLSGLPLLSSSIDLLNHERNILSLDLVELSSLSQVELPQPKRLNRFYSVAIGPNIGQSSHFESISSPDGGNEYVDFPLNERDLIGYASHLELGLEYGQWRFVSGINYSLSAAQYKNDDYTIDSRDILTAQGSSTTESTISKNNTKLHRFHNNVDVKLGLGRTLFSTRKFKLSANVNSIFNLYSQSRGYQISDDLTQVDKLENGTDSNYKKSNGIGGELSLIMERRIGEHMSLMIKPYFSNYLNPININTTSYKLENSQFGLMMGISYRPIWE